MAGEINSLESIPGLSKSFKKPSQTHGGRGGGFPFIYLKGTSSQVILQKKNHKNKHISVHIIQQHEKSVYSLCIL
jgi:hypothetical protein